VEGLSCSRVQSMLTFWRRDLERFQVTKSLSQDQLEGMMTSSESSRATNLGKKRGKVFSFPGFFIYIDSFRIDSLFFRYNRSHFFIIDLIHQSGFSIKLHQYFMHRFSAQTVQYAKSQWVHLLDRQHLTTSLPKINIPY
jgi:hypothetical protein